MNKEKNKQTRKKHPSFISVNSVRANILGSNLTPAVVMKKIKLRDSANASFRVDDLPELNDDHKDEDLVNEAPNQKRLQEVRLGEELSLIHTMTSEELNAHIQKCLEMSSENKITPKNAFALQLIDVMNVFVEKQQDFSAMACTLDAGAKIYSNRVDALHHQVVKLAEEVVHSHKGNEVGTEEDTKSDGRMTKENRKARKKNLIASSEALSRKMKEKDPKEKFIKLGALPGEIQLRVRRDAKDLSFTLENSVPFWQNWKDYKPLKADGTVMLPKFKVFRDMKKMKEHVQEFIDSVQNRFVSSSTTNSDLALKDIKELPINTSSTDEQIPIPTAHESMDDLDYDDNNHDPLNSPLGDETKSEEVDVVSTAMKRLQEEAESTGAVRGVPSRFEAMKMVFSKVSDYHYLDMKNAHYWAGPEFWKRPKGVQSNKEKNINPISKKKRQPREISYENGEVNEKWIKIFRRKSNFAKRTIMKWKKNKFTLPEDLKFEMCSILNLFHISTNTDQVEDTQEPTGLNGTQNQEVNSDHSASVQDQNSQELMDHSSSPNQDFLNSSFYERVPGQVETPGGSNLNSAFYDIGLKDRQNDSYTDKDDRDGIESGKVIKVQMSGSDALSFDETTLVPVPKIVTFKPIKYSTRPIRVDMQHLKQTMLEVLKQQIERNATEKDLLEDVFSMETDVAPETRFSSILQKLPEVLQKTTAADLTPHIAFLALLTLANENNLQLVKCDDYSDVIVRLDDK